MKNVKRVMTLGCVVLLVMANVCGCGMQTQAMEKTEEENNLKELQNAVEELAGNSDIVRHSSTAGKEETVYAILDAGGNPVETIVSEWLKNPEGKDDLSDVAKDFISFIMSKDGQAVVTEEKYISVSNEEYKSILVSSRVLMDNRQFYIKEFDNNYYFNFKSDYRFFKFIEIYVRTRIFDMKAFKNDMEMIIQTIDTEKLPGYKRLLTEEYWKISDEQFPKVIDEIIDNVKNGDLELIDLIKLYAYFSYFSRRKLINYSQAEVKQIFLDGMDLVAESSEYVSNVDEELSRIGIDVGEDMAEVLKRFHEINKELKTQMFRHQADEVFKCIPMRMETFYDRFITEWADKPILNYYDVPKMVQRITCASNEDIMKIKEMLIDRAKKHRRELEVELPYIVDLKEALDQYCKGRSVSIKIVLIKEFARDLENIIEMYKNLPQRKIYTKRKEI